MKCVVKDGKEAVNINNVDRYCYEHYQVYDGLQKLYQQLSNSDKSISWQEYLTKVLNSNFTAPWKIPMIDDSNGMILPSVASVASIELKQQQ
jgi:hypothetical protein